MTKDQRRHEIERLSKSYKRSSLMRLRWAEKRLARQDEEPRDTTIESAGNPDCDLDELLDLVLE